MRARFISDTAAMADFDSLSSQLRALAERAAVLRRDL
jgi:hypothetical protein